MLCTLGQHVMYSNTGKSLEQFPALKEVLESEALWMGYHDITSGIQYNHRGLQHFFRKKGRHGVVETNLE